jgi:hypothetical protein
MATELCGQMPAVSLEVEQGSPPVGRGKHWLADATNWNLHKHEEKDTWFWGYDSNVLDSCVWRSRDPKHFGLQSPARSCNTFP